MSGHVCSVCDKEWTHDNCTAEGYASQNVYKCPPCNMPFSSVYPGTTWKYTDPFLSWAKDIRDKAGVK